MTLINKSHRSVRRKLQIILYNPWLTILSPPNLFKIGSSGSPCLLDKPSQPKQFWNLSRSQIFWVVTQPAVFFFQLLLLHHQLKIFPSQAISPVTPHWFLVAVVCTTFNVGALHRFRFFIAWILVAPCLIRAIPCLILLLSTSVVSLQTSVVWQLVSSEFYWGIN